MKWINVLHLYQPPTQTREIIDQVTHESYEKILHILEQYPNTKITLNISGSLLELLIKNNQQHIIDGLRKHAERGAVELLGSAMYHPILPLLEEKEILRQIRLNDEILQKCFGKAYVKRGFYFPEMAYSHAAGLAVARAGFKWTILDEIHTTGKIDWRKQYEIDSVGLGVIFRDGLYSKKFPPESIVKDIEKIASNEPYLVTCHDGELYGHWHKDDRGYYEKVFTNPSIQTLTISEYIDKLTQQGAQKDTVVIRDASWESQPEELEQNISLGLWNHPRNDIHNLLEVFKRDVLTIVESHQDDPGYALARHHADRGVASCAWWWASERKIGPFSPVSWNPTEIEKGAKELRQAIISLSSLPTDEIARTTSLFHNLKGLIWKKHKEKYDPNYLVE
jgi:peptidoglycan/xylan/chitin deacetylase (PgdA/CDA1 family)